MTTLIRTRSFIETQFPVSKVSKESYKERMAGATQTLTGLGKWWGRKPLVLVRAALLGLLLPPSENPKRDREIFLKLMTMDEEGMWQRKKTNVPYKRVYELLTDEERDAYFRPLEPGKRPYLKRGSREEKAEMREEVQRLAFGRLSYDEQLDYCYRPENIEGPSPTAWEEINAHLGTSAGSLPELVRELGERRFGRVPRVGDAFAGGGSVPFEAARIGCDVFASDLNPVATFLNYAAINIVGGGEKVAEQIRAVQEQLYEAADRQITEWGLEHNEEGWRAEGYLYCVETQCPECGMMVPLLPSLVVGQKSKTIVKLKPDEAGRRFEIEIEQGVSSKELSQVKKMRTVSSSGLECPACGKSTPMQMIRGDRRGDNGTQYGLRLWENEDVSPRPDDTFQERLYCIRWLEEYEDKEGQIQGRSHYRSVSNADLEREQLVLRLLRERFQEWQELGFIPSRRIEPGDKTDEPIRTRGWTHWHHLFTPRQLLVHGLFRAKAAELDLDDVEVAAVLLGVGRCANFDSRLSIWDSTPSKEMVVHTFSNQALNTLVTFGSRPLIPLKRSWLLDFPTATTTGRARVTTADARNVEQNCDIWITDPPYADAVNYHELSEYFLAWYEKGMRALFPQWYTDSKRALAITGDEEGFRRDMVAAYSNLAKHMPDDGLQIVMFTHQDVAVWAELALILWAAGLRVTAAWTVATETSSTLKQGNYVQGTALMVLRKRLQDRTAFEDEVIYLIEEEVQTQLDSMRALDEDEVEPSFGDTDYQLAAYAAALRVLTQYSSVAGWDIERELAQSRDTGEPSPIERVIEQAVKIAADHLVPRGIDAFNWKILTPPERLYLKGLELEAHGEFRTGAYQELARGFGVADYERLFASKRANESRFMNATEFGTRMLGGDGFESSVVRHALMAIREARQADDAQQGRLWLREELADYWGQRKQVIAILHYLAATHNASPYWKEDGRMAGLVAAAVEHDHT